MTKEERHYRNVASLPCAQCGIFGYSQAAHSNRSTDGKAKGLKADYLKTFPLCCTRVGEVGCHVRHDQYIGITREEASERTDRYLASTEAALRARGLWPDERERDEAVRKAKPIQKKVTPAASRAIVKNVVPLEERSREPVGAGRGLTRSFEREKKVSRIVSASTVKENARSAPSRWPQGRKLQSGNRLQSRPFGSR